MDALSCIMLFADSSQMGHNYVTVNLKNFSDHTEAGRLVLGKAETCLELPEMYGGLLLWSINVRNGYHPSMPRIFLHSEERPVTLKKLTRVPGINYGTASIRVCAIEDNSNDNSFLIALKRPEKQHQPGELQSQQSSQGWVSI